MNRLNSIFQARKGKFAEVLKSATLSKVQSILMLLAMALTTMDVWAQEGAWSGDLDIQGTKLSLVFHFDADGCTMDSPMQGAKGIKAEKSNTTEGKLVVKVPAIGATYEGLYLGNMIVGTFTQGMASLPLTLKPGALEPNRPQNPKGPFPYTTEEVTFRNGDFVFNGTLTLPTNCTKNTPAVVMVTGSGQQNRDEELMDHRPFAVIADALARGGIASLRYDDRGWNDPAVPFYNYCTYDFLDDARAAISELRKRFKKVGVVGHSEGGTLAFMLASEGRADFIVSLAGMVIPATQQMILQNRAQLSVSGIGAEEVDTYCKALDELFALITEGKPTGDFVVPAMSEALDQNFRAAMKQWLDIPYFTRFLSVDAGKDLPRIKCPVLALNGKKDLQVDWEPNLRMIDNKVKSTHEVVALEGMNHLFQHCQTGALTEYQQIEETIAVEVLEKMIAFIIENTKHQ